MKSRFEYKCIHCKKLIAASNVPLEVSIVCWECDNKHILQMKKRKEEKLNVDQDYKKNKAKARQEIIDKKKAAIKAKKRFYYQNQSRKFLIDF